MDELLLLSGNDIPFPIARLTIHQPRLRQIAYIGESTFWAGCELLRFDKSFLIDEDKNGLSQLSNFNILMSVVQQRHTQSQEAKINILSVLALIFPTKKILLKKDKIELIDFNDENDICEINQNNFEQFKQILIEIFCLNNSENKQYNPSGELAKKIADKLKKGREARAKLAPETKLSLFSRYASILAVGQQKDLNSLMEYTVYQIMDEFNRFELKLHFDSYVQYSIAGAKNMQKPDDWLKDIHTKQIVKDDLLDTMKKGG